MTRKISPLYKDAFEEYDKGKRFSLGPLTSNKLRKDPQYVLFQVSRYKHISRLLNHKKSIIDIGSGDGVGLPILCSYFKEVAALDVDEKMLNNASDCLDPSFKVEFMLHDFNVSHLLKKYKCACCFDVLSLIDPLKEEKFLLNISKSLDEDGILALGTQNKLSTIYGKKENHLDQPNFKTYDELLSLFNKFFTSTIILSMNDETIHTGKREMAQYFIALGFGPKLKIK